MAPSNTEYITNPLLSQDEFRAALREEAQIAVRSVLETAMREELTVLLQAELYARTATRRGRRNGYYHRDLVTAVGPLPNVKVPRDRAGRYQTSVFERFARYQSEITEVTLVIDTLTRMFFGGVSQSQVGPVVEPLLGVSPSASAVSRLAHDLEGECAVWRERPLQKHYRVIYPRRGRGVCDLDGVYFPILHDEKKDETPLLVALGVDEQGRKEVLSVSVAGAETADAWQSLVDDLQQRGVAQVDLCVTDGDAGLISVLERTFPTTSRQRCITHKERNVLAKVPPRRKKEVAAALKGIFAQPTRAEALAQVQAFRLRYEHVYPEAVACLARELADCLTFYDFPGELRRHIRTNNALEGLFHTIRQRTNKMGAFRNETSCVLIVYAVIQTMRFHRITV